MIKTCRGDWKCCQYARQSSSTLIECGYFGHCIYQLPNDGIAYYGQKEGKQDE